MLCKEITVVQDDFTFELVFSENIFFSPFDDIQTDHDLESKKLRSECRHLVDILREVGEGDFIIDSSLDIYYRVGNYHSDSYYYYDNLVTLAKGYMEHDNKLEWSTALQLAVRETENHVDRLQRYVNEDWCYIDVMIKSVKVTKNEIINGCILSYSEDIEIVDIWHMIEWDNTDDRENYGQLSDLLLDVDDEIDIVIETVEEICILFDTTDWLEKPMREFA